MTGYGKRCEKSQVPKRRSLTWVFWVSPECPHMSWSDRHKRKDTQTERVGQADTGQRVEAVTSGHVHTATSNFKIQVRALPWGLWRECGPANTGTSDFGSRIMIQYIFLFCFQPWEMNRMSNITYHAWEYLMCSHLILIICSWKAEPWTYPSEYPEKMTVHCDCHVSSHRQVELPQRYMLLGASKKQR